jgi:hypothetical protein
METTNNIKGGNMKQIPQAFKPEGGRKGFVYKIEGENIVPSFNLDEIYENANFFGIKDPIIKKIPVTMLSVGDEIIIDLHRGGHEIDSVTSGGKWITKAGKITRKLGPNLLVFEAKDGDKQIIGGYVENEAFPYKNISIISDAINVLGEAPNVSKTFNKLIKAKPGEYIGKVSDLIERNKVREIFKDVLDVPVYRVASYELNRYRKQGHVLDGALIQITDADIGKYESIKESAIGDIAIVIEPRANQGENYKLLIEEFTHALRHRKGRKFNQEDFFGLSKSEYDSLPEEKSAKKIVDYVLSISKPDLHRLSRPPLEGGQKAIPASETTPTMKTSKPEGGKIPEALNP